MGGKNEMEFKPGGLLIGQMYAINNHLYRIVATSAQIIFNSSKNVFQLQ